MSAFTFEIREAVLFSLLGKGQSPYSVAALSL